MKPFISVLPSDEFCGIAFMCGYWSERIIAISLQILDTIPTISEQVDALEMAIKALEQQPSDTVSRGAFEQVMWERDVAIGQLKELGYGLGQKVEPCEDAISRQAVLDGLKGCMCEDWVKTLFATMVKQLPSVTQKSGKWDRLYSWLNDMRLGIAPDETVDDIDERHCRESQTDILDEIMEWMIKAESEEV